MRPCLSLRPIPALVVAALIGSQTAKAQVTVTAIVPNTAVTGSEPVPLRAQVAGAANPLVTWKVETPHAGACTLDAAGNWSYLPPQHREEILNVQLRAASVAAPGSSGVATLVLMPTNNLWQVINSILNGQQVTVQDEQATAVGGKRKAGAACEDSGQGAAKRQAGAEGAIAAAAPAKQKWQPAAWMQANGNAHFASSPLKDQDPEVIHRLPGLMLQAFPRAQAGGLVLPPLLSTSQPLIVGYKTPLELEWGHGQGFQPRAQQLSLGLPGNWLKEDVTGRNSLRLTPEASGQCLVHGAMTSPAQPHVFFLEAHGAQLAVRGLLPWAGHPGAPGLEDGTLGGARFTETPLSLAHGAFGQDGKAMGYLAATEAGSNAIRCLHGNAVTTPWGKAGEPGHVDGAGPVARFRQPTFLSRFPSGGLLVADTGNQVIRLAEGAQVRTLAGVPGQGGHRDGPGVQALFHTPQGLCAGPDGTVYVADQGNHVIRAISPQGVVSTLAGLVGQAGTEDGVGDQARFTQLRGMTRISNTLFALDGHAVRRINLDSRKVATVCGKVDVPGFAPHGRPAFEQGQLVLRPTLRNPRDLAAFGPFLLVADEGNHCVQKISALDGTWSVVAGDPGRAELSYGLLRDGLPGPLAPTVGTLAAPMGVASHPLEGILVSTGSSIAKLSAESHPTLALPCVRLQATPRTKVAAAVGEPCAVIFLLTSAHPRGDFYGQETAEDQARARREALPLLMEYELEFRNADGSVASRKVGTCAKGEPQFAQGSFSTPGKGRVVFRGRTHQGVGVFAEGGDLEIEVQ